MNLRITGTESECAAAVEALRMGTRFVVREVSTFYPNRGPGSLLGRVYLDVSLDPGPGPGSEPNR